MSESYPTKVDTDKMYQNYQKGIMDGRMVGAAAGNGQVPSKPLSRKWLDFTMARIHEEL